MIPNIRYNKFTRFEKARIIGSRALQIAMGAPLLVKITKKELEEIKYNPIEIAKIELRNGVIPLTIKRIHPRRKGPALPLEVEENEAKKEE